MIWNEKEVERLENAQLVIIGVPPGEIETMPEQLKYDVLALYKYQNSSS